MCARRQRPPGVDDITWRLQHEDKTHAARLKRLEGVFDCVRVFEFSQK